MKRRLAVAAVLTLALTASVPTCRAQTSVPRETDFGFSRDVTGSVVNVISGFAGCPAVICVTNVVPVATCTNVYTPVTRCYTNPTPVLTGCSTTLVSYVYCRNTNVVIQYCYTNSLGVLTCTNAPRTIQVCQTNLYPKLIGCLTNWIVTCYTYTNIQTVCTTNLVPRVSCTNDFGGTAVFRLRQTLTGILAPNATCDELDGALPTSAAFQAVFYTSTRQPDWRGYHTGSFYIRDGTNVVVTGSLTGINGIGSHRALESCAPCGHIEGTLTGVLTQPGPLKGARLQAAYSGEIAVPETGCLTTAPPQGPVTLWIDGLVITTNCWDQSTGN